MDHDRWALSITFDPLEVQEKTDPELQFPNDECSQFVSFLIRAWHILPEDFQEIAEWGPETLTVTTESLEPLEMALTWIAAHTVPQKMTLQRNESR